MAPDKSDLPQGTLDLLILTIVSSGAQHGYAIAQRLQQISRDVIQVRQGSLYPALHRLKHRGLLTTEWRPSETGREAKYYTLTKKGREALDRERDSWRRLTKAISSILRTAEGDAS
jgi:PadR family transcriptional regulator PadR